MWLGARAGVGTGPRVFLKQGLGLGFQSRKPAFLNTTAPAAQVSTSMYDLPEQVRRAVAQLRLQLPPPQIIAQAEGPSVFL